VRHSVVATPTSENDGNTYSCEASSCTWWRVLHDDDAEDVRERVLADVDAHHGAAS
jgi:hypothetical protein